MVNINLMGDDKGGNEEKKLEETTQDTNFTPPKFNSSEYGLGSSENSTDYDYNFKGHGSSNISTYIIIGAIVILSVLAYFLIFKKGGESGVTEEQSQPIEGLEETPQEEGEVPGFVEEPPTSEQTPEEQTAQIPGYLENIILSTKASLNSVVQTVASVPSNAKLTLLSQVGNKLTLEIFAPNNDGADQIINTLRGSLAGDFEVVSKEQVRSAGQTWIKVLILNTLTNSSANYGVGQPTTVDVPQLSSWMRNVAQQSGIRLRTIQAKQEIVTDSHKKVPIFVRITGDRASLGNFLTQLANQSFNIETSKVILASPERERAGGGGYSMVLYLYLYEE